MRTVNSTRSATPDTLYLLDLLVDNDAYSMLCDIIDAARLAMVALMRHAFLNGSCALLTMTK